MRDDHNINELVKNYRPPSAKSKEEAWQSLNTRLQQQKPVKRKTRWFTIAAAIMAIAVVFAVLADSFLNVKKYSSDFGEQQNIILSDSSEVVLAPNSSLKVNYSFLTGKRKLVLWGQAMFTVQPGKTFLVKFNKSKVTVLGTRFMVKSYKNTEPEIKCLSGKVEVVSGTGQTILQKGEGVVLQKNSTFNQIQVDDEQVWNEINGRFSFQMQSLRDVFSLFEARLGYQTKASETIKERTFTGEINMADVKTACDVLAFAMNLNYSIDHQNQMVIFEAKN